VLGLLAAGLSNAQIAARLVLSERTVAHHVSAVLRKLDARTRGEASAQAARLGLTGRRSPAAGSRRLTIQPARQARPDVRARRADPGRISRPKACSLAAGPSPDKTGARWPSRPARREAPGTTAA